jgi:hypothetical protein
MPITPQEFVSKWKRVTAREKQTYQEHFLDICQLVSHQTPNDYDPTLLKLAHKRLNEAVFAAYGWKSTLTDAEILESLLKLNLERGK